MKILAIGDIVSSTGCDYLRKKLPNLKKELGVDIVIANGENSAIGNGILPQSAEHILNSGVDVITLGNHAFRRREIYSYLDSNQPIIRPANYCDDAPGKGYIIVDKGYCRVAVINILGTTFMDNLQNPFNIIDDIIDEIKSQSVDIILVDMHAEVTSEKKAMGFYLDGKVSAIYGTHTHIQTSDAQILPNGTGYLTDLGMTGAYYSVLGVKPECVIEKFKTNMPVRFLPQDGPATLEGCLFEIDNGTGKTTDIKTIRR